MDNKKLITFKQFRKPCIHRQDNGTTQFGGTTIPNASFCKLAPALCVHETVCPDWNKLPDAPEKAMSFDEFYNLVDDSVVQCNELAGIDEDKVRALYDRMTVPPKCPELQWQGQSAYHNGLFVGYAAPMDIVNFISASLKWNGFSQLIREKKRRTFLLIERLPLSMESGKSYGPNCMARENRDGQD